MQTVRITTSQNIDIDYELAGLGERIVGSIIDFAIFFVLYFFFIILGISLNMQDFSGLFVIIIYAVLYVFYDLACEVFMNGQSIGKKIMKVRVISQDGAQPRLSQYLLRWLLRIIDFGLTAGSVALVTAAISTKVQRLGDLVAGTIVIKTQPRTNMSQIAFVAAEDNYIPLFPETAQLSGEDIDLVNEVINTYIKTDNNVVVYNMAQRIKKHLGIAPPAEMNDLRFLQTIIKDYTHQIARAEVI
ncbi:RDD family protein [Mucilaginibacter terrenus]|uniref:RDD family protein n=1 Tax=Mucilaginibacter terrenus TaxID=2482727 RepID=A0A3E2NJN0_9SPHI|nr:RDD family protein [Mucilaginibacter terrenus]RFZ81198.1 RDD family protein [Mucilaginibacter terrenus]